MKPQDYLESKSAFLKAALKGTPTYFMRDFGLPVQKNMFFFVAGVLFLTVDGLIKSYSTSKTYLWEDFYFAGNEKARKKITFEEAQNLIDDICKAFQIDKVELVIDDSFNDYAAADADFRKRRIRVKSDCIFKGIILHEMAHILEKEYKYAENPRLSHGPAFRFFVLSLYRRYLDENFGNMVGSMSKLGMKIRGFDLSITPEQYRGEREAQIKAEAARIEEMRNG